jgi:hypothetical protein
MGSGGGRATHLFNEQVLVSGHHLQCRRLVKVMREHQHAPVKVAARACEGLGKRGERLAVLNGLWCSGRPLRQQCAHDADECGRMSVYMHASASQRGQQPTAHGSEVSALCENCVDGRTPTA